MDEPLDTAPFELLTQKEQWRHIQSFHGYTSHYSHNVDSKSKKADLEAAHAQMHLREDKAAKAHTHTGAPPSKGDASAAGGGKDLVPLTGKPLNVSQRKALKDLVENDFAALKAEITQFAGDIARQKREEIKKEWAQKGADKATFEKRARDLAMKYRNDRDKLIMEARTAGVELTVAELYRENIEAKLPGMQAAFKAAEDEIDADKRRALNALERARLVAQRTVLMTGVTEESLAILETIPDAKSLMAQATAERSNPDFASIE